VKNGELFGNKNILGVFRSNMTRNVRGVENVFTQHEPLVVNVAEQALKGKLKDATFPYSYGHSMSKEKYTELIVFIVGGATFEEAAALKRLEMSNTGSSILLGGNTVHNMESFLDEEVIGDKVEDPRNRLL
jgi:vacuolar protein sorting-associated protein 45